MSQDAATIRVLVVDDQPLLREGIAALIADQTDIAFVGDAPDRREAVEQLPGMRERVDRQRNSRRLQPDPRRRRD